MKKIILVMMVLIVSIVLFTACSSLSEDSSKYGAENYIGPADVDKQIENEEDLKPEEMSAFTIEGETAYMSGVISADTVRQVKKLIKDYPDVKIIQMVSVDGSVDDEANLIASRLVREAGLNTHVAKDGKIASGGTDFFCAGVKRTIEEGAQVGVHSWASEKIKNAGLLPKNDKEHEKYIAYYKEMEMLDPEGFYFFTINAAEANSMYFMTQSEMKTYGLIE